METLSLQILLASTLAGASILFLIGGAVRLRRNVDLQERLGRMLASDDASPLLPREEELSRPFIERVLGPLARQTAGLFLWLWPQNRLAAGQRRLLMAGSPGGLGAIEFFGVKLLTTLALGGVAVGYGYLTSYPITSTAFVLLGLLLFAGFGLPDFWLSRKITQRQKEIMNSLPDALDMLLITSEAGMSFESGLTEIIAKWNHALAVEFARVLRDIGMGQNRREALLALSDRTGVPDVVSFVAALNQADELGVSIGRVLRAQADDMRTRRRQRAYEQANKTPVKMMIPLVFLIFPSIFAVLLGPALVQIVESGIF
jgi:tight adherence protein C